MNKDQKSTSKYIVRLGLLALIAAGSLLLGNLPKPETAHAASTKILATSDFAQNSTRHYTLKEYRSLLGPGAVDWPTRAQGCVSSSVTPYKTTPWQASNGATGGFFAGNYFLDSGNCANRYVDGGNPNGAWAYPWSAGGWAYGYGALAGFGWPSSGWSANVCGGFVDGGVPMIWGAGGPDFGDQAYGWDGLLPQNGWASAVNGGYSLYSNGTTLYRNTFYIDPADYAGISNVRLSFQADDWMRVYLNGNEIITTTWTSSGVSGGIQSWMLNPGNNILAIQVADKAIWNPADPGYARGSGLCYNLAADFTPPPPPPPPVSVCPNLPGFYSSVPVGYFLSGGICIPDLCPNISGGQNPIPAGDFINGAGNCVPDLCLNISGGQNPIPPGMQPDGLGNCVFPALPAVICTTTDSIGECVVMNGLLYINPPKFFDNTFGVNMTQSQGERPPLY